jgi:hypothetical protein
VRDTVWRSARVALGIGLVALLALGVSRGPEPGEPVLVDAATTADDLAALLVRDTAATLTYADSTPPTRAVTALLASAAESGAEVALAVPGDAGRLRVVPPDRAVAGRRAALGVHLSGEPGEQVPVTIHGQTGAADTVVVPIGPDGRGASSVAVEPSRPGAASWTVRTPGAEATAHAWVRPETPLRVLVWSGPPGWESRWLIRALEAAGAQLSVRQDLGRDLAVTSEGAKAPRSLDDLAVYDVLVLVDAAADSADALAHRWVAERGGGLLLVGASGSAPTLGRWAPRGEAVDVAAADLDWRGPAEVVPLPAAELVARGVRVSGSGTVVVAVGSAGDIRTDSAAGTGPDPAAAFARAAYVGRGRIYASGLETWPWAMEAGLGAEHAKYWESVVEWLAGGLADDVLLAGEPGMPGVRWEGRLEGDIPTAVTLRRPGRAQGEPTPDEPLPDEPLPTRGDGAASATVAFVPVAEGAHALDVAALPARAGGEAIEVNAPTPGAAGADGSSARADASEASSTSLGTVVAPLTERLSWTAAAAEIGAAGGRIVSGDEARTAGDARPARRSRTLPWIGFLLLAALAVAGWTARRVGGRP